MKISDLTGLSSSSEEESSAEQPSAAHIRRRHVQPGFGGVGEGGTNNDEGGTNNDKSGANDESGANNDEGGTNGESGANDDGGANNEESGAEKRAFGSGSVLNLSLTALGLPPWNSQLQRADTMEEQLALGVPADQVIHPLAAERMKARTRPAGEAAEKAEREADAKRRKLDKILRLSSGDFYALISTGLRDRIKRMRARQQAHGAVADNDDTNDRAHPHRDGRSASPARCFRVNKSETAANENVIFDEVVVRWDDNRTFDWLHSRIEEIALQWDRHYVGVTRYVLTRWEGIDDQPGGQPGHTSSGYERMYVLAYCAYGIAAVEHKVVSFCHRSACLRERNMNQNAGGGGYSLEAPGFLYLVVGNKPL